MHRLLLPLELGMDVGPESRFSVRLLVQKLLFDLIFRYGFLLVPAEVYD